MLEHIAKPNVHVYGVHGEGDGVEVAWENVVNPISEVCINGEMLKSTPRTTSLKAPKPAAKVAIKIIDRRFVVGEVNLFANGRPTS